VNPRQSVGLFFLVRVPVFPSEDTLNESTTSATAQTPSETATGASAPTVTPAVAKAVAASNFSEFRSASRAQRGGSSTSASAPAATTDTTDASAAAAAPASTQKPDAAAVAAAGVSKRQQETNDRIREAVERATADLRAENEALKRGRTSTAEARTDGAETTRRPANAPATAAAADPEPNAGDLKKYPGGEFDPKFVQDQARWAARDEHRKVTQAAADRASADRQAQVVAERETKFSDRMKAAREADPTFLTKLSAEVADLRPYKALAPGERATVATAIAELVIDSENASELMLHLSTHPDDFAALKSAANPMDLERRFGRLEAKLEKAKPAAGAAAGTPVPQPKHVPAAPAPAPTLGSRGGEPVDATKAAVKRGDFGAFRQASRQARQARSA
jgi:hypothetical protein